MLDLYTMISTEIKPCAWCIRAACYIIGYKSDSPYCRVEYDTKHQFCSDECYYAFNGVNALSVDVIDINPK